MRDEKMIKKMVKNVVRVECRDEAEQILLLCEDKWYNDFVKHYNKGKSEHNVCCMSLDFAKYDAVLLKKMKQKKTDKFGDIGWMLKD